MAHLSNELFSLLMISYKVHVQSSCRRKKSLLNVLAPKPGCRGVRQRAPSPTVVSSVLYAVACPCTGGQNKDLNFDFLGGRELRDGFLDPQSCESGRRVGVPALSHQFAHHTERLACDTEEKTPLITLLKIYI